MKRFFARLAAKVLDFAKEDPTIFFPVLTAIVAIITGAIYFGDQFGHVVNRFFIHLFSAPGAGLLSFFGFYTLARTTPGFGWVTSHHITIRLFSSLVALLTIFLREPADVAAGGILAKSYVDLFSWALGFSLWMLASWRYFWAMAHILKIEEDVRVAMRREGWIDATS